MNCDEAKNTMTIRFFGELNPDERIALESHLRDCPDCARIAETLKRRNAELRLADAPPQPDWEKSWEVIAGRSFDRLRPGRLFGFPAKWVPIAASLLAVFILGAIVGRKLLFPPAPPLLSSRPAAGEISSLGGYLDTAEAVVIDFLNRGASAKSREVAGLEQTIYKSMLAETRLLQSLAEKSEDVVLKGFLDEMESLLLSLSNLKPGDRDSADLLDRTIRGRGIRAKLRELSNAKATL
jgi:hypothetical protein